MRDHKPQKFYIDTMEKSQDFHTALKAICLKRRGATASKAIKWIIEKYPDLGNERHEVIAELIGTTRETVTRAMNSKTKYEDITLYLI